MSLYSQNVSNNPLMLDGLVVGNFDEVYINGVPVNTDGYVPYTGSIRAIDLNTQKIQTSYTPTTGNDLTNKTYTDATYALATSLTNYLPLSIPVGGVSVGGNAITWNNTMIFNTIVKFLYAPSGTVASGIGIDSTGSVISYTPGNASLTGGTSGSYQYWSGWNQFSNTTKINSIQITGSIIAVTGTPTYLAVDSTGQVGFATPSINQTNVSGGATNYFIIGNTSYATGSFTASVSSSFFWNNSTGLTTTGLNVFGTVSLPANGVSFSSTPNSGSSTTILALDGTNKIITTTISTVPTQINPTLTTALTTYYPAFFQTNTVGAKTVYTEGNGYLTYVPSSTGGTLGTPTLYTGNMYNTGAPLVLEGRGASAPINMYSTSALNFYIGTVASSTIYGNISTSGFTTTYVTAPTIKTDNILSNGATNLVITGINGGNVIIKAGVSTIGAFSVAGLDTGIYPVLTTTINGLGGTISFQTASTTYATITTGLNTNNVNSFASNPLTLTGTNGIINMVSTATTVASISTSLGIRCDLFSSTSGNNMTFNAQGAGDAFLYKFAGTSVFSFTNSSGPVLNANSGTIQFAIGGTTYASISTTQLFTPTKTGSSLSYLTFSPSTSTKCAQLTNTNTAFGANIFSYGNWSSGNFFVLTDSTTFGGGVGGIGHWGSTTGSGFASLSPGTAWLPLYFGGSSTQVYYYGGLAVYLGAGGWVNVSDERYKNNIKSLKTESSLKRVLALRPCTYKRNFLEKQANVPIEEKEKQCIGFIAQEVKESNPHCVSEVDDQELNEKRMGINYQDYIIHLVGGIQEQQKMILTLQAETILLTSKVKDLQAQVQLLTNLVMELK